MSAEPTKATGERASIVDVFENFFGDHLGNLSAESLTSLPRARTDELVESVDRFLELEVESDFNEDAICVDSLANPILAPRDPTEPLTTRKAKQVSLMHSEVVFPMTPLFLEYASSGLTHVADLLLWARKNERLLRKHVFTLMLRPNFLHVMGYEAGNELLQSLTDLLMEPRFVAVRQRFAEVESDREAIEAALAAVLTDAVSSGTVRGVIEFLDQDAGLLYDALAGGELLASLSEASDSPTMSVVQRLDLPAIDAVSDEDFVAIRLNSEDFASFRDTFGRALEKTKSALDSGAALDSAFRSSLDEVRFKAELLRTSIKDKALLPFLRKALQSASVGALVGTASAWAADVSRDAVLPSALAARGSAAFIASALLALVFYRAPTREERLLRFYNVLLSTD